MQEMLSIVNVKNEVFDTWLYNQMALTLANLNDTFGIDHLYDASNSTSS